MRRVLLLILVTSTCLGFRLYQSKAPWKGIARAPNAKTKVFVVYDNAADTLINDVDSSDSLYGTSPLTVAAAMNSIFLDYNNIQGAYVQLVDSTDPDYATDGPDRTIRIKNQPADGVDSGQAKWNGSVGNLTECTISLTNATYKKAKSYLATATHEIGHCLGLDHAQDTVNAIMSYFNDTTKNYRLQIDDKMGILFLYPIDPGKAREDATLGMSCSRR